MMNKTSLQALAAAIAATTSSVHSTSFAQDSAAHAGGLEEVVVTAQRRASDLQTTASAISAYSGGDLQDRAINDIEDLGQFNPSMDVAFYQGEAQIYMRGIGYSGIIGGTDSSTALHLNGVFLSRSSAAVPGFMDVERVEVVKGPQGTLYGRNATSGSVNIISKRPTEEFTAEASIGIGNYNSYKAFGAIGGSVVGDSVRARLAIQKESRDGYTTLIRPVDDPLNLGSVKGEAEGKDDITARLSLEMDIFDETMLTLIGDYYEADDTQSVWTYLNRGTATNPFFQEYIAERGGTLPKTRSRRYESDIEHFNKPTIWGVTGRLDTRVGDYDLMFLSSYRGTNPLNRNDLDTTSAFGVDQVREEDQYQFSQEIQLSSPSDGKLVWIAGMYYFSEDNDIRNEYFLPFVDEQFQFPSDPDCCLLKLNGTSETEAYAVFGELTYDIGSSIELVLGARYGEETRGGSNDVVFENFAPGGLDNVTDLDDKTFDSFTPKLGINYTVSDNVFAYANISEGFKSGGYNIGSYQNTPFDPEEITSYEAGVKADLLDNRLRINSAVFIYDYTDLQIQDTELNNTIVRNAANADIQGIEIDVIGYLTDDLRLEFGAAYLNAEFSDAMLIDPKHPELGVQDLDGFTLPRAPEFKVVGAAEYGFYLENQARITVRADVSWQSEVYFSSFNVPDLEQDSYTWLKARASYEAPNGLWNVSAFIDNITDEVVASNGIYNGDIIDSTVTGSLAPPRTYGLEFSINY